MKLIKKEVDLLIGKWGTPFIIYDEKLIHGRIALVRESFKYAKFKLLYALKANTNVSIIRIFKRLRCGVDVSSPGDAFLASKAGFASDEMSATGPNWTDAELEYFIEHNIAVDLDSVSHIKRYGEINPGGEIGLRINPGVGSSPWKQLTAGGKDSKLGICLEDIENAKIEARKYRLKIIGLHFHIGSSSFDLDPFVKSLKITLNLVKDFPHLRFINIGGGCGVKFHETQKDFDIKKYGKIVVDMIKKNNLENKKEIELRIELGEFLMWPCACAISTVNTIKYNGKRKFIGIDINSNHIPTPSLYGSYHVINTFSKKKKEVVDIAGNLCQAGDILAKNRSMNKVDEGDIIIIQNAGAYCIARSSHFNSRLLPKEILKKEDDNYLLIREEKFSDLLQGQIFE
ncbi:MAG: diaminopimelate decarboxylase [Parcubacteria group bacterium]|jgi:diaminopimelate decarboxylase